MNTSPSIKLLAVALKKAQSEMGEVKFDSDNPFYKSQYASLGAVIEASKNALASNGFSVSQPTVTNEFGIGITTILMHESGEWIESTVTIPLPEYLEVVEGEKPKRNNLAQEAGKIITYLRRYSLASILNLYSDEDTDGEGKKSEQKSTPKVQPKADGLMTLEEAKNVVGGNDNKKYGVCTAEELAGKLIGITKALNDKKTPDDKRDELIWKMEAIKIIQASRK